MWPLLLGVCVLVVVLALGVVSVLPGGLSAGLSDHGDGAGALDGSDAPESQEDPDTQEEPGSEPPVRGGGAPYRHTPENLPPGTRLEATVRGVGTKKPLKGRGEPKPGRVRFNPRLLVRSIPPRGAN